ncbi:MAG: sugar ABC transporter substrate-binding protein [Microbacteriaceae bacterium]
MGISAESAKKRWGWRLAVPAVVATAALALSGCASNGGGGSSTDAAGDGPTIAVIGGMPSDGFWTTVKNGAEAAGAAVAANGGKVEWYGLKNYDNLGPDAGDLVRTAIANGVDAIAVPDWVPEAENEAIKQAVDAGIAVVIFNAGGEEAVEATGALMYVGTDEYKAGVAGGKEFAENGAKNIICVNTNPGSVNQESRCKGVADGAAEKGAKSTQLPLPSSSFGDQAAISQAIKGALTSDPSIDGVITIGAQDSDAAASGVDQAGATGKVKIGTFDLSENVLKRIADGTQLFAIDQQPYLQGYLAASYAWQYVQFGITSPLKSILTGPSLVTADNVATVTAGVAAGAR